MNLNDRNLISKIETFFQLDSEQIIETSLDGTKYEWSNSTFCNQLHYDSFFLHFIRMEVEYLTLNIFFVIKTKVILLGFN